MAVEVRVPAKAALSAEPNILVIYFWKKSQYDLKKEREGGSKAVRKISENSSILEKRGFLYVYLGQYTST